VNIVSQTRALGNTTLQTSAHENVQAGAENIREPCRVAARPWANTLSPKQREIERKVLHRIQAVTNYTRNPRFLPPKFTLPGKSTQIFQAEPATVTFTEYEVLFNYIQHTNKCSLGKVILLLYVFAIVAL